MKTEIFNYKLHTTNYKLPQSGQATLFAVVIMLVLMLSAVFGATALSLKEASVATINTRSRFAYFASEAGIDDAVYRLKRGKNLSSLFSVALNGATAQVSVAVPNQSQREITATGDFSGVTRAVRSVLSIGSVSANFYYGVQVGDGGLTMGNNAKIKGNVYSNYNITGSNNAAITGDVIVAGGINADPSVEWTFDDTDQFFATLSSNRDIAQSFTANASGRLNKLSVYLGKAGNPTSAVTARITIDNGGKPSNSSLASTSIMPASVGATPSWVDVSFSAPTLLTSGTKYWIVLDYGSNSSSNYWNWRKDSTDGYTSNTSKYTSDWSQGSAVWTSVGGDLLFKVWIGGTNTKIDGVVIGTATTSSAQANLFLNTTVHGSACPNQYCIITNPPRQEMPISDGVIADWKNAAAAGGTIGSLNVTGSQSLGPKKISGSLTVTNNASLTLTGTIWVTGNINFSNNCNIGLAPSYGSLSGVIVADGIIDVSNNCIFSGSGTPGSYIMLLSDKNAPASEVIEVSNNSLGVIYYASKGKIEFSNNAQAKEATAYGIEMENNATISYESGLANVNFSSGPSGGWDINSWTEIVP